MDSTIDNEVAIAEGPNPKLPALDQVVNTLALWEEWYGSPVATKEPSWEQLALHAILLGLDELLRGRAPSEDS